jgi:histidinol-phosphate aminotransferase
MTIQGFRSPGEGLRLHLNENTGGCSSRVIEAIRALTPTDISAYADCRSAVLACAAHFGVDPDWVLLTNGLDEGILMTALGTMGRERGGSLEAIVPMPAFDPYLASIAAVGATAIRIPPLADFAFPVDAVLDAITPQTRVVFLNTPSNPTGQIIPHRILRLVARKAPHAVVLIDEAYVEFAGNSFLDELPYFENVIIGRTFSKAYGLAGIRIGCLIGHPDTLDPIRLATPVLNLNVVAITALEAALKDAEFLPRYRAQVEESRRRLYAACDALGLKYWDSSANFVLIRVGSAAPAIAAALAASGVHVRDRSGDPHTPGCIRITAGIVEHTDAAVAALEATIDRIAARGAG